MRKLHEIKSELNALVTQVSAGNAAPGRVEKLEALTTELKHAHAAEKGDRVLNLLAGASNPTASSGTESNRLTRGSLRSAAHSLAIDIKTGSVEQRAAVAMGSYTAPVKLEDPATMGHGPEDLVGALGAAQFDDRHFSYIRQTSRALNAAVVAPGELKPTSAIGLERAEGETQVIAHVSDPVDEMLLADLPSVSAVVGAELLFGLHTALEAQVLTGTGTGQLHGLLTADGIQVVSGEGRPLDRIRRALTNLVMQGYKARAIALSPSDWEAMELATTSGSGELVLNTGPVDSSAQRLWGVPVVLSASVPVGTAVVVDTDMVGLATTGPISLHVGQPGDCFTRNQVVFRAELRAETMIKQAAAIVKVFLTEA
ncbi:phage major capsid protein [Kocuria marina]|uniref:phage major capsid protein n=1 Tax=Kocuria marina TaxID=223184 RepID=UPI00345FF1A5